MASRLPRTVLREPQKAEQLVEVPTVVSYSSLQQTAKQTIDIPVPRTRGDHGGLQGFHSRHCATASVPEQIVDIPVGGGLQDFLPDPGLTPGPGVHRTLTRGKKCGVWPSVRRSP